MPENETQMTDEEMFPEEGFPVGGKEAKPPEPEQQLSDDGNLPWLRFLERFPKFKNEPLPEGLAEAASRGETPTEAYLRLENDRLEKNLRLLRVEKMLRETAVGPAKSDRAESPVDDFAGGLLYE